MYMLMYVGTPLAPQLLTICNDAACAGVASKPKVAKQAAMPNTRTMNRLRLMAKPR
jgi:hypothetical protein